MRVLVLLILLVSSSVFAHGSSHAERCTYNQRGVALVSDCVKGGKYYQRVDPDYYTEARQIKRLESDLAAERRTSTFLFVTSGILLSLILVYCFIQLDRAMQNDDVI